MCPVTRSEILVSRTNNGSRETDPQTKFNLTVKIHMHLNVCACVLARARAHAFVYVFYHGGDLVFSDCNYFFFFMSGTESVSL